MHTPIGYLAKAVIDAAKRSKRTVATAESCTGGLIAAALTDVPGASQVFHQGFVVYANAAKAAALGVPEEILERHGAVSAETAKAMAAGAMETAAADIAVSVTGVAGPGGGTPEKPVGLVYFGLAKSGAPVSAHRRLFLGGGRGFVRGRSVETALRLLRDGLHSAP